MGLFGHRSHAKTKKNGRYRQKQAVGAAQERHKCGFSGQIRHLPSLLCIWIIYPPQVHQPRAIYPPQNPLSRQIGVKPLIFGFNGHMRPQGHFFLTNRCAQWIPDVILHPNRYSRAIFPNLAKKPTRAYPSDGACTRLLLCGPEAELPGSLSRSLSRYSHSGGSSTISRSYHQPHPKTKSFWPGRRRWSSRQQSA